MPRVIQVIESSIKRGKGIEGDPVRSVTQYHTLDGELLAERDPEASPLGSAALRYTKSLVASLNESRS